MRLPFTGRAADPAPSPAPETKSSTTPLVAVELSRRACFTAHDYGALCREGFARNPIVYRCVRLIAEAAASVPLRGALPTGSRAALERFYGYLQVAGAAYLHAALLGDEVVGLSALRPDTVQAVTDRAGRPAGFAVDGGQGRRVHARDPLTGRCAVMALTLFNPLDEVTGQSPLEAAATSVDLHNQGTRWAKSLLDNSARPSGALVCKGPGGAGMPRDRVERLKEELERSFSGPMNAGRPMVLEGGLDWTSMGLSPSDMDFTQSRREAARDIALAFGVPPMLLGIPGDNTYSNYAEANRAFWRQTVMPLVGRTASALQDWLSGFAEVVEIQPDFSAVPALAGERAQLWAQLNAAGFIDDDERRALAGLAPRGTLQ